MKFSGKVGNGPMNKRIKFWWRSGSPSGYRDCFPVRHYWEIWKVVSSDCAARRCSARHALASVVIATMTSLRHRPTTDSGTDIATLVRRALAEVCTVPVLLLLCSVCNAKRSFYRSNNDIFAKVGRSAGNSSVIN